MEQLVSPKSRKHEMALGFFALVYALLLLLVLINELAGYALRGYDGWQFCYMFTYQSNILVLVWLIGWGITRFVGKETKFGRFADNRTVITAITVYISITFFIVAFVLSSVFGNKYFPTGTISVPGAAELPADIGSNNIFVHFATPIVMWAYFFLAPGRGDTKYRNAWYILIYPFIFVMANLAVGGTVNWSALNPDATMAGHKAYAYGFINPFSYHSVFIYILVLVMLIAIFGGFGVLLIKFKKYLVKHYYGDAPEMPQAKAE